MARSGSKRTTATTQTAPTGQGPQPPRLPAKLEPRDAAGLTSELDWTDVEITGDVSGVELRRLAITSCRIEQCRLTAADFAGARFIDVLFDSCELSGADLTDAGMKRVEFRDCRMSGVQISNARLSDVQFSGCKLDGANFRMAATERVLFDQTVLHGADFSSAGLPSVQILRSDLTGADFSQARLRGARLNGSTLVDVLGAGSLRDLTIDPSQVMALAYSLFGSLGIAVTDPNAD